MKTSSFESVLGLAIAALSTYSKYCTAQAGTRSWEIGTSYFLLLYLKSEPPSNESTMLYSRLRMSHSATISWWMSGICMIVYCQSWSLPCPFKGTDIQCDCRSISISINWVIVSKQRLDFEKFGVSDSYGNTIYYLMHLISFNKEPYRRMIYTIIIKTHLSSSISWKSYFSCIK